MEADTEASTGRMWADAEGTVAVTGAEAEGVASLLILNVGTSAILLREDPLTGPE